MFYFSRIAINASYYRCGIYAGSIHPPVDSETQGRGFISQMRSAGDQDMNKQIHRFEYVQNAITEMEMAMYVTEECVTAVLAGRVTWISLDSYVYTGLSLSHSGSSSLCRPRASYTLRK